MIIKVCGMSQTENIRQAETLGIDWMGFIFWPRSPRNVMQKPAYLPTKTKRVGVFVGPSAELVKQKAEEYGLDFVQLHGKETPEECRTISQTLQHANLNCRLIKAFSIATTDDLQNTTLYENVVDYFLFDTKCKSVGGSGEQFDWNILDNYSGETPFLLSGGIGPDSANDIKEFSHKRCIGIDLNSRFETEPGVKDTTLLETFIKNVRKQS